MFSSCRAEFANWRAVCHVHPQMSFVWPSQCLTNFSQSSRFPVSLEDLGELLGLYSRGLELSRARALQRDLTASAPRSLLPTVVPPPPRPPPPALPPQSLSFPAWALCRHLSISLMLRWMPEWFCGWSSLPPTSVSGFRLTDHCLCVRPSALVRCGPAPCLILAPSFAEPPISHL